MLAFLSVIYMCFIKTLFHLNFISDKQDMLYHSMIDYTILVE